MKKLAIWGTAVILSFVLTGCGKDAAAQKVQDDINSIGEVTLDDESLIEETYETYNTLTDKQKNQVDNYADLLAAKDKIDELKTEAKENEIKRIVGEWDGLAIFVDEKLTKIDKGRIIGTINDDNTFNFEVNGKTLSGVWAEIDSSQLNEGETAYNFVSDTGEQVAQGILSTSHPFIDPNSTYTLSVGFDAGDYLLVQFER